MDIGGRVRGLRKKRGLRREELAAKAGISLNTIANLERGAGARTGTLEAVAAALGVEVSELFISERAAS